MAKTFVLKDGSSEKRNKKKIVKKVIFGLLIIAEILLFLQFIIPYVNWLQNYINGKHYIYYARDTHFDCAYCDKTFVGAFKYLAIQTHCIMSHIIGDILMDSFGLFIVPDYLAHLILLVVLLVVIFLLRPKKKKSAPKNQKTNRSRQTITITFS